MGTKYKEKIANTTAPLTLVPNNLAIVDSGCTRHFLGPSTPCTNKFSTSTGILVGLPNGSSICTPHTALLSFPQLPIGARQSNVFSALGNRNLIYIGQLCDHGFSEIFTAKYVNLICPNTTLTGMRNTNNGLYYIDLQSTELLPGAHIPQHYLCSNNVYTLSTNSDIVQYLHQVSFSPVVSTWNMARSHPRSFPQAFAQNPCHRKGSPPPRPIKRTIHQKHFSLHSHLQAACYDDPSLYFSRT